MDKNIQNQNVHIKPKAKQKSKYTKQKNKRQAIKYNEIPVLPLSITKKRIRKLTDLTKKKIQRTFLSQKNLISHYIQRTMSSLLGAQVKSERL